jgi:hypothetical protein
MPVQQKSFIEPLEQNEEGRKISCCRYYAHSHGPCKAEDLPIVASIWVVYADGQEKRENGRL